MRNATVALISALILATGCYGALVEEEQEFPPLGDGLGDPSALELFQHAADAHAVPRDLLVAIAWQESSFVPTTDPDWDETRPVHGWMGLTPERVAQAAALTGASDQTIRVDREANVLAAAVLLSRLRDELAPEASPEQVDVGWWPVLVAWPEFGEAWLDHDWARGVFRTLQAGLLVTADDGETIELEARRVTGLEDVNFVPAPTGDDGARDILGYPGRARFVSAHSSNYGSRSAGASSIERVVLHTTEGSYAGAVSWFQDPSSNVSSHYVVRRSDGEITQMVSDEARAWHACNNNDDTVGIEHEGASASASTWTPAMVDASARMTAWLVVQYSIPIDRDHIVGHGEIQPPECSGRSDPGPWFPWDDYMTLVAQYAGDPVGDDDDDAGDDDDDDDPSTGWGPLAFLSPTDGGTVADPVQVSIQHPDNHVELWQGPALLVPYLFGHPANYEIDFWTHGGKSLTARAYRASGAFLAAKTIQFEVVDDLPGDDDDDDAADDDDDATPVDSTIHDVFETELGGATLRFTASAGAGVALIEYRIDGWLLPDDVTGLQYGVPSDFDLTYTFNYTGERSLEARAYDAGGYFTDSLSKTIVVPDVDPPDPGGCTSGYDCVESFPFDVSDNTSYATNDAWNYYSCSPSTNESGPEVIYEVVVPEDGFLAASIVDGSGVDVDVHILSDLDPDDCVDRGHEEAGAFVTEGTWYVVIDTWVSSSGVEYAGAYDLTIAHTAIDAFVGQGLEVDVMTDALTAFDNAWAAGETDTLVYSVIDFSLSSTDERLWTIDLADSALMWSLHVSHGSGSGHPSQNDLASSFSNVSGSHQSSLGLARTAETYSGSNGYSMRLDGLDPGYNSNVRSRAIVVHGATYARPEFAAANGYLGRSWGCPAVDDRVSSAFIDDIKLGSLMFSWYPDGDWSVNSDWLD
jgi:hypothetical protein